MLTLLVSGHNGQHVSFWDLRDQSTQPRRDGGHGLDGGRRRRGVHR
jgi:hypothetical protein